jgi:cyclase
MDLIETPVRPNVFVYAFRGGETIADSYGANCTAVVGRDAVLLVDPLIAPAHARRVEAAVASRTRTPVRFVVLTHHHTDHALGSSHFARQGAAVVAHPACAARMAAEHPGLVAARRADPSLAGLFADAEPADATVLVESADTIDLGGTRARILHTGHGHTPGDIAVHLPEESVGICGDLVSNGYHVNYEDAAVAGLARGLETLASFGCRTYIPGHGLPAGPELLAAQARYHALAGNPARLRQEFPTHLLGMVLNP